MQKTIGMGKYGKWIGAGIGWAFIGPIGALIGLAVGATFDRASENTSQTKNESRYNKRNDFITSLLVLAAAVMKADQRILKSELEFVKKFLINNFGQDTATDATLLLRDLLTKNIPVNQICDQIKMYMDYHARVQLLHFLYGIAQADGHVSEDEVIKIQEIAYFLDISSEDISSIKNMFYKDLNSAYKILGINQNATIQEIKKAYRKKAIEYHPDKVEHLGEDIRKGAEEKFKKVNEAYEQLKKERAFC